MSETAKTAPACTLVLFGAAGDLVKRLLMPALYDLAVAGLLHPRTRILGVDRADLADESWRDGLTKALHEMAADPGAEFNAGTIRDDVWNDLAGRLSFVQGDIMRAETFSDLRERIEGSAIFYCALASRFFAPVAEGLGRAGLLAERDGAFRRLVVEKPFGSDLASARALNEKLLSVAREDQIFRVDHFLGKESVQSILAWRFASRVFEPVWSHEHVDHLQITAAETLGVEGRGAFYEQAGALRDMVPNHLFQLLAMTGMEAPASLGQRDVRDAKAAFLRSLSPVSPQDAVRGQYGAGLSGGGPVPAYREEPGVSPASRTETFAALKLTSTAPRWQGVPFYLRTGKRMAAHRTEVVLVLKAASHKLFDEAAGTATNRLVLRIDGIKGLAVAFQSKVPGPSLALSPVEAIFRHDDFFVRSPNVGYETLLHACQEGDATLFQRADSIEAAWAAVEPVLEAWSTGEPAPYAAGSAGPTEADALAGRDGRMWDRLGDDPDARIGANADGKSPR